MKTHRLIARLDIKGPNLVKGIHLEGLRVLGDPSEFAKYYYANGADEIMYMDVVASLYERNSLQDIISQTAKSISIPMLVGGGLRTLEDINEVLRAGADRVSLNTAAIKNPEIISQAAQKFGSSTIVVAIEAIQQGLGGEYLAYTDNGREHTGVEVVSWAKEIERLGAGEIMITSVDREGTGIGFDTELTKKVSEAVGIPVVAHGGCSGAADVVDVIKCGKADAVAVSSVLHYDYISKNQTQAATSLEGNTSFIKSGRSFSKIAPHSLNDIKKELVENGVECRYEQER